MLCYLNFFTQPKLSNESKNPHIICDNKVTEGCTNLFIHLFPIYRSVKLALCPSTLECLKLSRPLLQSLAPAKARFQALKNVAGTVDLPDESLLTCPRLCSLPSFHSSMPMQI